MIVACYHRFASASRCSIRRDTGPVRSLTAWPFDRPLLKCYKSAFCAALVLRLRGASSAPFGGSLGPACGGLFLVECEQFALRSRQTALRRKSVPESAVPASSCPVKCL